MVSVTRAAHDVEITAESLQEDLARLEMQKQALERELAAVVAHLSSVQRALGALHTLMGDPAGSASAAATAPRQAAPSVTAPRTEPPSATSGTLSTSADVAAKPSPPVRPSGSRPGAKTPAVDTGTGSQRKYGKLTEQILEYFTTVGDADVRARDVAAALGRDTDSGAINAVRSTLDRLVGTSRIRRTGRGLYRAKRS
ncbi:hypothetical protein [Streptomyces griseoloalbus]|uniref:Uncharacterized protein n=1 Tax=Streptomyces griseoloalbus TaxID=67303 RepID=A0A7W8FBV5_9ACTN|nr:hypothetical protein [Streptomyces albaduncus]MBB5128705.1 hypothetical protein [Streptomyces albaduncus]GGW46635.1 hypothetical protein GCM10010340_25930 [Streptomyces albaduncus]